MPKQNTEYTAVWVTKETHAKLRVLKAKKEMTFDQLLRTLLQASKKTK